MTTPDERRERAETDMGGIVPDDTVTPSRRAGLYDEIVNALGNVIVAPPVEHRRQQADQVLALLYREWAWLRAEAEDAVAANNGEECPRTTADNSPTSSDTTDNPATVTDPAYLRQQYAEAIAADDGHPWDTLCADTQGHYLDNADAALAVRDRHLEQLRQRLALADTELANWAASDSADAAAGSYAHRAETAEWQRDRHAAAIDRVRALAVEYPVAVPTNLIDEALDVQEQQ